MQMSHIWQEMPKGKKIHKVTEEQNNAMDDLADRVQSLFYHDIHFNAINMWIHTRLECEIPHGLKTNETFKIICQSIPKDKL